MNAQIASAEANLQAFLPRAADERAGCHGFLLLPCSLLVSNDGLFNILRASRRLAAVGVNKAIHVFGDLQAQNFRRRCSGFSSFARHSRVGGSC
ncbi:hypothetical protein GOP47_0012300 [Adiantum capillus-veneris]|uniref:Uncharacterized protein n=1 Tax=Adiantum capillus-veneris TaxID=13818 RepID=A0A9D4UQX4_ADICA|nr:hypothetical protein GOP47_0012300 [Adiantum capillus-veneris]